MKPVLTAAQLDELKQFDTPTVSNAIESFGLRPRETGFVDHTVRCQFPDLGVMVGYATTCVTAADVPHAGRLRPERTDYLDHLAGIPAPRVAVSHDADRPPGVGAFVGEVNGSIHKALGVIGHVTDGCARDFDQLQAMGFQVFCLGPCVSHAHIYIRDVGVPVRIGGCLIRPGDLIHGDRHGVCVIPHECAAKVADACRKVQDEERDILDLCRSPDFSLEKLKETIRKRWG